MPSVSDEKIEYEAKLNELIDTYSKIIFVGMDNVRSQQVHGVRRELRGKGVLLGGKKTHQKRIISIRANKGGAKDKEMKKALVDDQMLTGNKALLFTNADVSEIQAAFDKFRIQAPARVGAIAPCDVMVPAGNTGLEPTQTSFFQALNIATKISKGTVEIITDKKVLGEGDKVDNSTAALLQKLKISPFFYSPEILCMWERGVMFTKADLKVTDATLEADLLNAIANVSAISLGAGIPTETTVPIMLLDAFKDLLAVSVATEYTFEEYDGKKLRDDIKAGKLSASAVAAVAVAPAGAAAPAAAAAAPAAKAPEPEEEEDDDMGMGLFD